MNPPAPTPAKSAKRSSAEDLRQQLIELDTRFGLLGGQGLFDVLDRSGCLFQGLAEVGDIEYATQHPPLLGRARLRGEFVRQSAGKTEQCGCDWMGLWNGVTKQAAQLTDPFCSSAEWHAWREPHPPQDHALTPGMHYWLREARRHWETARYTTGLALLRNVERFGRFWTPEIRQEFLFLAAFLRSRCGVEGGLEAFTELVQCRPMTLPLATLGLNVHLHMGLVPHPGAGQWLLYGDRLLASTPNLDPAVRADFLNSKAALLNRSGRAAEAVNTLTEPVESTPQLRETSLAGARRLAELGESHRLLGRRRDAARLLTQARKLLTALGRHNDHALTTLLYRAKLGRTPCRAHVWLAEAERLLQSCSDKVSLLKVYLLKARTFAEPALSEALQHAVIRLRAELPVLHSCTKLTLILEHWPAWCGRKPAPDNHEDFFWGI